MSKEILVNKIVESCGTTKKEAALMLDTVLDVIVEAIKENDDLTIYGFGKFVKKHKEAHTGRNPKTGEEIPITARRVVTFRPGQKLKARVDAFKGEVQ